jgi:2-hydroxy-3-keto-5-methylthiopentenyl-1-phosphate phosphatase
VIAQEFATVRAPLEEVVAWLLERARVRPGFHELVEDYRPVIVSSGFHETIEPILRRERLDVPLLANRVEATPDGWRVRFRDETTCTECGEACKRAVLPAGPIVYVGDGASDRCAVLAAERVFARDGLAQYLTERGVEFEAYSDLHDVHRALRGEVATATG